MSASQWTFEGLERDVDGIAEFSEERPYNIDEESYDERYKRGIDPDQMQAQGRAFARFVEAQRINTDAPMLEIGCGTGRLTAQMVASGAIDRLLVTDGSKSFVRITKRNMETLAAAGIGGDVSVDYACLVDEDFRDLPNGYFGAISMFGVLHHFLNWRSALAVLHNKLVPGGSLFFSEPSSEFMLTAGLLAALFEHHAEVAGIELAPESRQKLRNMKNAAALRISYDPEPKMKQEDKHAFRIDDIAAAGRDIGYDVTWLPNATFSDLKGVRQDFRKTAMHRFAVVNGFSEALLGQMDGFLDTALSYLARVGDTGAGPHFDCLYVLRKR